MSITRMKHLFKLIVCVITNDTSARLGLNQAISLTTKHERLFVSYRTPASLTKLMITATCPGSLFSQHDFQTFKLKKADASEAGYMLHPVKPDNRVILDCSLAG
jgi:hypothetical protein